MIGKPKYKMGDKVSFNYPKYGVLSGTIEIIDKWGVFEDATDVHYDILGELNNEPCLFKHIRETNII